MSLERKPIAVLFTQQFVGLGTRKTGMVFWAEALARAGYDTHVVTTQLSLLSRLSRADRLAAVPRGDVNAWRPRGEGLSGFVWVPPLHPARLGSAVLDSLSAPVYAALYPRFLPRSVRDVVASAQVVVIESCSAVLLFDALRAIAHPRARFVYCASDRLATVGMHPMLQSVLSRTAGSYDLVRVPARAMAADFPAEARLRFIPHGIDKAAFDRAYANPYAEPGPHAVVAGDMLFDREALQVLVDAFPDVTFHGFGRLDLGELRARPNVRVHGEVPFGLLAPHLVHADVGVAPYRAGAAAAYLAESSLKMIQYTYCRLPIVAPDAVAGTRPHVAGYRPGDPASIAAAMRRALATDRDAIDTSDVLDWDQVMSRVLASAGLVPPGAPAWLATGARAPVAAACRASG